MTTTRREVLMGVGAGALCAALPAWVRADTTPRGKPPNFVLIMIDDLGSSDLACCGHRIHKTPRLDAFAAEGIRFTQAYSASPVCGPTRAALMTGQFPARFGATDWGGCTVPNDQTTWAQTLRAAGYRTGHFGKWHLGTDKPNLPESRGFDVNCAGTGAGEPKSYFSPYANNKLTDGPKGEYLTDRLTDEAIAFIDESKGKPFFVSLAHYAVHIPLQAKDADIAKYRGKFNPQEAKTLATYAGMVGNLDQNIGRLLDAIEKRGLSNDTIVIFTSDHGGYFDECNQPLKGRKGTLYEGGIRVPLIVRWPGKVKPGTTSNAPTITCDLYPTLLDMAGVPLQPKQHRDGVSIVPLLTGAKADLDSRTLFWHFPHGHRRGGEWSNGSAVRRGDWKLVRFYRTEKRNERDELYNLATDPNETNDRLAHEPKHRAEMTEQLNLLLSQMKTTKAKRT